MKRLKNLNKISYEIENSDQYQIEFFANIEDFFAMLDSINPRHIENYIKNKTKKPFSLTNK